MENIQVELNALLFFCNNMIDKIKNAKSLTELANLIINDKGLDFIIKQTIINDLKYGNNEYLEMFKTKIIKIYKEINK